MTWRSVRVSCPAAGCGGSRTTGQRRGRGGLIALVEAGDLIEIDIPARSVNLAVPQDILDERLAKQQARERPFTPLDRDRPVSAALRAYASMASSAADGAVRVVP
ncbi:dihydroxy-acid dehydratase [Nostocoides veronense]|uniref:dihydroxy-acid dehydratase domain-containing protein n=1 Tax=Nostocoides veronense TaxID=330836 RepID=UPI0031D2CDFE